MVAAPCSIPIGEVLDLAGRIHATDRWFATGAQERTVQTVVTALRALGLEQVQVLRYPADGRLDHGGWVMPRSWDVVSATLDVPLPSGGQERWCDYWQRPCCLMLNSRSGVIDAPVVRAEALAHTDPRGKWVLFTERLPALADGLACIARGAVGLLSSALGGGGASDAALQQACQWHNYVLPHWPVRGETAQAGPVGFSLSPDQGRRLLALLAERPDWRVSAHVDARIGAWQLPMITGLLPGETPEELVLTGHLFEQGANDNASGAALALGILRSLSRRRRRRGIRVLLTYEARSLQAFLNTGGDTSAFVAGLNLDMVGVSRDKVITLGSNRPVLPSYAPALLKSLIARYPDFSVKEGRFGAMDNALADPAVGVPLPYLLLGDDPNYHKSADRPEALDPEVLRVMGEVAGGYLLFLANAGPRQAERLARLVAAEATERLVKAVPGGVSAPARAFEVGFALESLASVRRLGTDAALETVLAALAGKLVRRFGSPWQPAPRELAEPLLAGWIPERRFRGFFSFEKALTRTRRPAAIQPWAHGWNAAPWINDALMFSDGRRTGAEIFARLGASTPRPVTARQFAALFRALEKQGYLTLHPTEESRP